VLAETLTDDVLETAKLLNSDIWQRTFKDDDIEGFDIIIAATNNKELNYRIWQLARTKRILINVADTPDLCDFYLGSIVTKGDLKIAISTNGKSPTFAKRLREFLEDVLPDETNKLLGNLHLYRNTLKTGFEEKVRTLNQLTESLIKK
jgi:precorrin-2 dehydrogenase/sirohydrochlorin ferrochelatase